MPFLAPAVVPGLGWERGSAGPAAQAGADPAVVGAALPSPGRGSGAAGFGGIFSLAPAHVKKGRSQALSSPQLGLTASSPAASPSGALQKSGAGCDPTAPWQLPEEQAGGAVAPSRPCHVSLPGSPVPAQLLDMVPQEKSLVEILPCTLLLWCEPALGRAPGGLVSAWHCHQHPAPSAHFKQVNFFLCPSFRSKFKLFLCQSEMSFITLCPASTGDEAELLPHFISRVCL